MKHGIQLRIRYIFQQNFFINYNYIIILILTSQDSAFKEEDFQASADSLAKKSDRLNPFRAVEGQFQNFFDFESLRYKGIWKYDTVDTKAKWRFRFQWQLENEALAELVWDQQFPPNTIKSENFVASEIPEECSTADSDQIGQYLKKQKIKKTTNKLNYKIGTAKPKPPAGYTSPKPAQYGTAELPQNVQQLADLRETTRSAVDIVSFKERAKKINFRKLLQ